MGDSNEFEDGRIFTDGEKWSFGDTILGVLGKSGEAALIGLQDSQPTIGSRTVNFFMPRVRQTFFPL